jgi:hypothetical protein
MLNQNNLNIASCPCVIRVVRWIGLRRTHVGFVTNITEFVNSLTLLYPNTYWGDYYYFDINKITLTRDINKAAQINLNYENRDEYFSQPQEINLTAALFENKFTNKFQIEYYYNNDKDSSITDVTVVPILRKNTLESIQNKLDTNYPPPRKTITKEIRQQVFDKYSGHCAYCGKQLTLDTMEVDHIISHMYNKGKDEIDNYMPACQLCNRAKDTYNIEEFRNYIENDAPRIHWKKYRYYKQALADKIVDNYHLNQTNNKVVFYFEKYKNETKNENN